MTLAQDNRAEYLCYCTQTRELDLANTVKTGQFTSFNQMCQETQVGMHCTSCILKAEQLYLQIVGGHAVGHKTGPDAQSSRARGSNSGSWLQRWSPFVANRMHSVCPVLLGRSVRTILCISNPTHPRIKTARIRSMSVDVQVRNSAGVVRGREKRTIEPNAYVEIDLSRLLASSEPVDTLTVGSASLVLKASAPGQQGAARPHFKFVTPNATAAVHTVSASGLQSHLLFTAPDAAQRSFVFVLNMAEAAITSTLNIGRETGATLFSKSNALPPTASAFVEIPQLTRTLERLFLQVQTTGNHRAFFITGNTDLTRISADHI